MSNQVIKMKCREGFSLQTCLREAAIECLEEAIDVQFDHQGTTYHVSFDKLIRSIQKR